jgi:glycosyltransferase involved in cell wall biosynthesis
LMKIAILSYRSNPFSGGQGIYVRHLSNSFVELGHEVYVISGPPYPDIRNEVTLIKIPSLDLFSVESRIKAFKLSFLISLTNLIEWLGIMTGGFPEPYTFGRRLKKFLESSNIKFDVILDNQSLCYALEDIQNEYPLVTTIHHPITKDHKLELEGSRNWKERLSTNRWHGFLRMQKKVAPNLKHIITISNSSKEDIQAEFKIEEDSIDMIWNGIDIDTFKVRDDKKIIENRIVTTASADIPLKGLKYLIASLPSIIKEFPLTHLKVIGTSPQDSTMRALISDLDLNDKVSFNSELTESEVVDIYSSADIAVIPSLYEGFGFGAGEAMACGVPLISTTSGGLKDVIGDAAIKIESESSDSISKAVIDLFSDDQKKLHYSKIGRERIEKEFSWNLAARKYLKVFKKAIDAFKK